MKNLMYLLFLLLAFACQPTSQPEEKAATTLTPKDSLLNSFEIINSAKFHFFATAEMTPDSSKYPYVGIPLEGNLVQPLDGELQPREVGGTFACYHLENTRFFILRVPGKYASSDLALARWDEEAGKLKKVADLASLWCDEGACNQQDAWLLDLDDNRMLELITRSHHLENGKISDETFSVMTEDGKGGFVKADDSLASLAQKASYVMQENK